MLIIGAEGKIHSYKTVRIVSVGGCNGVSTGIHEVADINIQGLFEQVQYRIGGFQGLGVGVAQ